MINFENVNNRLLLELEESKNTADGACKQEDIKQRIGIQMYKTSAGSMDNFYLICTINDTMRASDKTNALTKLRDTHTSVSILQDYFKDNLYVNQSQQRKSTTKDYTNLCAELLKSNAKEDCFKNLNEPVINPSIITFLNKRMNNCSNSQITDCDVGELFSTYDDFGSSDDNRDDDVENLIKTSTHEMNKTSSKRQLADAPDIQLKKKNTINIANTDGQSSRISPKSTDVQDIDQSNIQLPSNIFRTSSKEVIAPIKDNQPNNVKPSTSMFRTAKDELILQHHKSNGNKEHKNPLFSYSLGKKSLGTRRTVESKFVLPTLDKVDNLTNMKNNEENNVSDDAEMIDERLKHIDPKMIEIIRNEIMNTDIAVEWDDIAGLEYAKLTIKEAVVWPLLRPDIFTGLRRPPRGILLFGPPGTGKTLIGKCIASQSRSTFFSISASSLTSKYVGEGEKMVRALFEVASIHQPAVVFIDEIDSLLCQRSDTEHESSRRIKTEFLVQLDGAGTSEDDRILFVGTTNRPQELDEAARRRFVKRLYIPLPELAARVDILKFLIKKERTELSEHEINEIGELTTGFSGADIKTLCHEASMGPIRAIPIDQMHLINVQDVRPINFIDFKAALSRVRASVSQEGLLPYLQWDSIYGSGAAKLNIS